MGPAAWGERVTSSERPDAGWVGVCDPNLAAPRSLSNPAIRAEALKNNADSAAFSPGLAATRNPLMTIVLAGTDERVRPDRSLQSDW